MAVCCSSASVNARLRRSTSLVGSAYDGAVGLAPLKGLPHSSQNFACGRFSCWHRGHRIPSVSRVRIVSACQGLRVTASGQPPELGVPAVPCGTGAPTLPRPGLGRQTGSSGAEVVLYAVRGVEPPPGSDQTGDPGEPLDRTRAGLLAPTCQRRTPRMPRCARRGEVAGEARAPALKGPWKLRSPSAGRVLSSVSCWSGLGYEARRRRTGRFVGTGSCFDLAAVTLASSFRPRLASSVATRSVVGGRVSTSTRWIS